MIGGYSEKSNFDADFYSQHFDSTGVFVIKILSIFYFLNIHYSHTQSCNMQMSEFLVPG